MYATLPLNIAFFSVFRKSSNSRTNLRTFRRFVGTCEVDTPLALINSGGSVAFLCILFAGSITTASQKLLREIL